MTLFMLFEGIHWHSNKCFQFHIGADMRWSIDTKISVFTDDLLITSRCNANIKPGTRQARDSAVSYIYTIYVKPMHVINRQYAKLVGLSRK